MDCFSSSVAFDNMQQQDAHEFLNYLLNTIADLLEGETIQTLHAHRPLPRALECVAPLRFWVDSTDWEGGHLCIIILRTYWPDTQFY